MKTNLLHVYNIDSIKYFTINETAIEKKNLKLKKKFNRYR